VEVEEEEKEEEEKEEEEEEKEEEEEAEEVEEEKEEEEEEEVEEEEEEKREEEEEEEEERRRKPRSFGPASLQAWQIPQALRVHLPSPARFVAPTFWRWYLMLSVRLLSLVALIRPSPILRVVLLVLPLVCLWLDMNSTRVSSFILCVCPCFRWRSTHMTEATGGLAAEAVSRVSPGDRCPRCHLDKKQEAKALPTRVAMKPVDCSGAARVQQGATMSRRVAAPRWGARQRRGARKVLASELD